MFVWLNRWAIVLLLLPYQTSADLDFQPFLTVLFIFHIIIAFHASLEGNSLRFLVQVSIVKQSLHRKKKMFLEHSLAASWNSNLLYQQHTGFPEHFSHSPCLWADLRSAQDFTVCSISFPVASGTLRRRLLHHGHSHSLESYSIAKRVYAVASYEMLFQPSLNAGSRLLQPHVLEAVHGFHGKSETVISRFMYWFDNWFKCFSESYKAWEKVKRESIDFLIYAFRTKYQRHLSCMTEYLHIGAVALTLLSGVKLQNHVSDSETIIILFNYISLFTYKLKLYY